MNSSIVLSKDVLNTIKSLPTSQQFSIISAIAGEMIFGDTLRDQLTEEEKRLYYVIKSNVCRDSDRYTAYMSGIGQAV